MAERVIQVNKKAFGNGEFTPIPSGTKLKVAVFDIEEVPVKSGENAGKPQIDLTVKVTEEGEFKGREIRYTKIPLYDGKAAWALTAFGEAVGWKSDAEEGSVRVPESVKDALGAEFIARVGIREGNDGKKYNTVSGYAKLGKGGSSTPKAETPAPAWGEV